MSERIIFHIDANSAFLSWSAVHALQHGATVDFREIPSIVGGNQASRHGIVLAKSIPAKKYGIQTGEPVIQAKQKYPKLLVIPPDYHIYMKCSTAMLEIVKDFSDNIQVFSIDEMFLDYTGMEKILGEPVKTAYEIKDRIKNELGFTVSIGVSTNKLLAKMASDLKKPDAVTTLYKDELPQKMWTLDVRDLYMVGQATEAKLIKMGIYTIGDLAKTEIENSQVKQDGAIPYIKGIGNSCTIHFDVEEKNTAHKVLLSLVETVCMRLRHAQFCCRLVQVSIKTSELKSYSHQRKFIVPTDCTNAIYKEACRLFDEAWKGEPIRHLGVRVSELCGNDFIQLSFLENSFEKQRQVDKAVDEIRLKYGSYSIFRAGFLHSRLSPLQGGIVEEFPIMTSIL